MLLKTKIALVTGAGSGIGRAATLAFAREGATVVAADLVAADETAAMVRAAGGVALAVKCDVTARTDVETMIQTAVSTYGRIDCAFNNAGVESSIANTGDVSEEEFDRQLAVNLKGVWLSLKYRVVRSRWLIPGGAIVAHHQLQERASAAPRVGVRTAPPSTASSG